MILLAAIARARGRGAHAPAAWLRGPAAARPCYVWRAMEGMPTTMEDRRVHPRRAVPRAARLLANDSLAVPCRTLDMSETGALLHGAAPLSVGQTVQLEVSRGGARNPLVLDAEVVRIETPDNGTRRHVIALRFSDRDPADRAALVALLASAFGSEE